jgi:hypothetical protein
MWEKRDGNETHNFGQKIARKKQAKSEMEENKNLRIPKS